jgi:hypothetical protein
MLPLLGGNEPSAGAVARHYSGLLRGFVVERGDEAGARDVRLLSTETIMRTREDRIRLAEEVLRFAEELA